MTKKPKVSIPKLHSIKWKDGVSADNIGFHPNAGDKYVPVREVLSSAYNVNLSDVVLFGYDEDGLEYIAGSTPDIQRAHYMFTRAALTMLRYSDTDQ